MTPPLNATSRGKVGSRFAAVADRQLWKNYARVYDSLNHLVAYREMIDGVAALSLQNRPRFICEIGCGTGNLLLKLSQRCDAKIVGVDPSRAMLRQAERKLAGRPSVGLLLATAHDAMHAFPRNSFQTVTMCNSLYALPNRPALWEELARVLAPGGIVVISHTDRPGQWPIVKRQIAEDGLRVFARPSLYAVSAVDRMIDVMATHSHYEFPAYLHIHQELANAGLNATLVGRTYGEDAHGINFLAIASK